MSIKQVIIGVANAHTVPRDPKAGMRSWRRYRKAKRKAATS